MRAADDGQRLAAARRHRNAACSPRWPDAAWPTAPTSQCRRTPCCGSTPRTRTARIRRRPAPRRSRRLVAHGHARGAGGMTDAVAQRAPRHAGRRDAAGAWSSAARCWSRATRSRWVGAEADAAAPTLAPSTPSTTSAARSSRRGWSTATPTSSTAASARASSSCACRARATKRSRAPAAASAPPSRPRARPATTRCFALARAARCRR